MTAARNNGWSDSPQARAILASIVANPPKGHWHREVYAMTRDEWFTYEGPLVDRLEMVRENALLAALAEAERTGLYAAVTDLCQQPDVTRAIDAALDAADARDERRAA